ncbi:MAG: transporter [Cyclobacteriaceae bacterium]
MRRTTINLISTTILFSSFLVTHTAKSQSLADGFMKGKGHGSLVLSYSWEQYNEFYFGSERMDAPPPFGGEITTQSVSLYGIYGLTDNLDIIVNLPFIAAQGANEEPEAPDQNVSDLQDVALFLKWRPLYIETESGNLSFLGAAGFATPLSGYEADAVLSIGNQATRVDARLMTQYFMNNGFLVDLQAGYSIRSNNVPNATMLAGKIGYAGKNFYIDVWSETQISDSDAPDIGDAPFNETRVNYTQIGISGYVPLTSGLGISAGVGRYISGRNVGIATRVSGGVVYSF